MHGSQQSHSNLMAHSITMSDVISSHDVHTCAICMEPLHEYSDDTSLDCGHTYHTDCINTYCESAATEIQHVECPVCKRTAVQISGLRSHAMRIMAIPGGIPDPPIPGTGADSPCMLAGEQLVSETPPIAQPIDVAVRTNSSETDFGDNLLIGPASASASPAAQQASPAASQASTSASAFPTSDVSLVHRPQYAPLDVLCGTCGSNVSLSRARCRSKTLQTWVCQKCEVKISQLRRGFGSWPVTGFTKISREDQQAFFRDAKDMNGHDFVKKAEEMLNISEDIEAQCSAARCVDEERLQRRGHQNEERSGRHSRASCARNYLQVENP